MYTVLGGAALNTSPAPHFCLFTNERDAYDYLVLLVLLSTFTIFTLTVLPKLLSCGCDDMRDFATERLHCEFTIWPFLTLAFCSLLVRFILQS